MNELINPHSDRIAFMRVLNVQELTLQDHNDGPLVVRALDTIARHGVIPAKRPMLEAIDLANNALSDAGTLDAIASLLDNRITGLQTLSLGSNGIVSVTTMGQILLAFPRLRVLSLANNQLSPLSIRAVDNVVLNTNLQNLSLSGNNLTSFHVPQLATTWMPNLVQLRLSRNPFRHTWFTGNSATQLRVLALASCDIVDVAHILQLIIVWLPALHQPDR